MAWRVALCRRGSAPLHREAKEPSPAILRCASAARAPPVRCGPAPAAAEASPRRPREARPPEARDAMTDLSDLPERGEPHEPGASAYLSQEMQLYGHRPYEDEPDRRQLPAYISDERRGGKKRVRE